MNSQDRDFLEEFRTGISAQLKANAEVQDMIYNEVKKQNGRMRHLEATSTKRGVYWRLAVPGAVIIFLVLYIIVETCGIGAVLLKLF